MRETPTRPCPKASDRASRSGRAVGHSRIKKIAIVCPDLPGASIFAKDEAGRIYHTYSTYTRGLELLDGAFNWLDLAPKGRNEVGGIMSWVRLHDEYETCATDGADCCR